MPRRKTRLFLAESHALCRDGLVKALSDHDEFELIGRSGDGRETLHRLLEQKPDVAVLSERLPGLDANQILGALRRDGQRTRLILLASSTDTEAVYAALAGGASGYLAPDTSNEELYEAIRVVARGGSSVSPQLLTTLSSEIQSRSDLDRQPLLSERERTILALAADGLETAEIAQRLHVASATVKKNLRGLYERLAVPNRTAAVAAALRRGLIE